MQADAARGGTWVTFGCRLLLAVIAIGCLEFPLARGRAHADPVSVSPDAGYVTRTINFADERGKRTIHFYFTAASALSAAPNATVRGVATADGSQFNGTIVSQATLADDGKTVDVAVSANPAKTKAGDYTGDLLLRGTGVTDARATLGLKLHALPWPSGSEAAAWGSAFGLLLLGAGIGALAQWLAGPGSKLHDLVNRYEIVSALGGGLQSPPPGYKTALLEAGAQLTHRELDAAEETIKALETKTPLVAKISAMVGALNSLFASQRTLIDQLGLGAAERGRLMEIVGVEETVRDDLLSDGWPEATTALAAGREKLPHLRNVSAFLSLYSDHGQSAGFKNAVQKYLRADYAAAEQDWTSVPSEQERAAARAQSTAATELHRMVESGAFEPIEHRRLERVRHPSMWLARHAPGILGLLVVFGLGIAGLYTVFDPNETFRTDAGTDAIKLFVWGLAAGLGGATVTQLTGKLTPGTATS
jgi:hypothetical protein